MAIYTKTGDDGETGLFDGSRVAKDDLRVAAYGSVDELNSVLGMLRAKGLEAATDTELGRIQADLFEIGGDLATPGGSRSETLLADRVTALEGWIDRMTDALPRLRSFILPGGSEAAALCHLARTVCRRAERACWTAHRQHAFPKRILVYINRLSDLLFVLARHLNAQGGVDDVTWTQRS